MQMNMQLWVRIENFDNPDFVVSEQNLAKLEEYLAPHIARRVIVKDVKNRNLYIEGTLSVHPKSKKIVVDDRQEDCYIDLQAGNLIYFGKN